MSDITRDELLELMDRAISYPHDIGRLRFREILLQAKKLIEQSPEQNKSEKWLASEEGLRVAEDMAKSRQFPDSEGVPGGLAPGEYMHEWMEKDAVEFDLPTEEIIGALVRDNKILHDKLKALEEDQ